MAEEEIMIEGLTLRTSSGHFSWTQYFRRPSLLIQGGFRGEESLQICLIYSPSLLLVSFAFSRDVILSSNLSRMLMHSSAGNLRPPLHIVCWLNSRIFGLEYS